MDFCFVANYSPPLYQLSYRRHMLENKTQESLIHPNTHRPDLQTKELV